MEKLNITDSNFDEKVLKSSLPVMVDFWASWCGPCKMLGPVIEELAGEYEGRVNIYKLNVDENPENSTKYRIRGIPAIKIFKDGQVVDELVGLVPKEEIEEKLKKVL